MGKISGIKRNRLFEFRAGLVKTELNKQIGEMK